MDFENPLFCTSSIKILLISFFLFSPIFLGSWTQMVAFILFVFFFPFMSYHYQKLHVIPAVARKYKYRTEAKLACQDKPRLASRKSFGGNRLNLNIEQHFETPFFGTSTLLNEATGSRLGQNSRTGRCSGAKKKKTVNALLPRSDEACKQTLYYVTAPQCN